MSIWEKTESVPSNISLIRKKTSPGLLQTNSVVGWVTIEYLFWPQCLLIRDESSPTFHHWYGDDIGWTTKICWWAIWWTKLVNVKGLMWLKLWLLECFLDREFLMAAFSNQEHTHFILFPRPQINKSQLWSSNVSNDGIDSLSTMNPAMQTVNKSLFLLLFSWQWNGSCCFCLKN